MKNPILKCNRCGSDRLANAGDTCKECGGVMVFFMEEDSSLKEGNQLTVLKVATGYHMTPITKGDFGEVSKILEEVQELQDAHDQGVKIMMLCELSDLYLAMEGYLAKYHPDVSMDDLKAMAATTRRAFESGQRK